MCLTLTCKDSFECNECFRTVLHGRSQGVGGVRGGSRGPGGEGEVDDTGVVGGAGRGGDGGGGGGVVVGVVVVWRKKSGERGRGGGDGRDGVVRSYFIRQGSIDHSGNTRTGQGWNHH